MLDGSTSKGNFSFDGKTSGRIAMEIVGKAIHSFSPCAELKEVVEYLTNTLQTFYREHGLLDLVTGKPENRPTCSLALYSRFQHQIWLIGDVQCRIDGKTYTNSKHIDNVLGRIRADVLNYFLQTGFTEDELRNNDKGRQMILPYLREQCHFQNAASDNPFAYAVIDGFKVNTDLIKVVDTKDAHDIILASDGYPEVYDSLNETEQALEKELQADSLRCRQHFSTKGMMNNAFSFDDRTFLRIKP